MLVRLVRQPPLPRPFAPACRQHPAETGARPSAAGPPLVVESEVVVAADGVVLHAARRRGVSALLRAAAALPRHAPRREGLVAVVAAAAARETAVRAAARVGQRAPRAHHAEGAAAAAAARAKERGVGARCAEVPGAAVLDDDARSASRRQHAGHPGAVIDCGGGGSGGECVVVVVVVASGRAVGEVAVGEKGAVVARDDVDVDHAGGFDGGVVVGTGAGTGECTAALPAVDVAECAVAGGGHGGGAPNGARCAAVAGGHGRVALGSQSPRKPNGEKTTRRDMTPRYRQFNMYADTHSVRLSTSRKTLRLLLLLCFYVFVRYHDNSGGCRNSQSWGRDGTNGSLLNKSLLCLMASEVDMVSMNDEHERDEDARCHSGMYMQAENPHRRQDREDATL